MLSLKVASSVHETDIVKWNVFWPANNRGYKYTTRDNCFVLTIRCLRTMIEEVSFFIRTQDFCQCGCKGYCTLYPLLLALALDLCMAGDGFGGGKVVVVCDLMCDWPAYLIISCLRYWNHAYFPCPCCNVPLSKMMSLDNITHKEGPWEIFTHEEYNSLLNAYLKEPCRHVLRRSKHGKKTVLLIT